MIKILFVCSGNIFRSMSAEKCLKKHIKKMGIKGVKVDSAGIAAARQKMRDPVRKRLIFYKINTRHKQKKITKKLVGKNDLIIAMAKNHQEHILKKFKIKVPLYKEVAFGKKEDVQDIDNMFENFKFDINNKDHVKYLEKMVDYMYKTTPRILKNIKKFTS